MLDRIIGGDQGGGDTPDLWVFLPYRAGYSFGARARARYIMWAHHESPRPTPRRSWPSYGPTARLMGGRSSAARSANWPTRACAMPWPAAGFGTERPTRACAMPWPAAGFGTERPTNHSGNELAVLARPGTQIESVSRSARGGRG
jgi:hypothetical protein